jgi:hypothetical protein
MNEHRVSDVKLTYFLAIIFLYIIFLLITPAKGEPHVRIYDCGVLLEDLHQRLREFAQSFLVAFCHLNRKTCIKNSIYNANQCCGSEFSIPDPGSASKKLSILTQKPVLRIRIRDPVPF